jgi:hypothetical protein
MIMKVAVPLPKHSPMFGQLASSHTVTSLFSRSVLDFVEARRGGRGFDADPVRLFQALDLLDRHDLDGNARSFACAFCFSLGL